MLVYRGWAGYVAGKLRRSHRAEQGEPSMTTPILAPFSGEFHRDPYATYRRLRETDPVHCAQILGTRFFVLTRYADVTAALRDPRLSSAAVSGGLLPMEVVRGNILFADPPQHSRQRQPLNRAFLPATIEACGPDCRGWPTACLTMAQTRHSGEGWFDVVNDLAVPLSLRTITAIMGLPTATCRACATTPKRCPYCWISRASCRAFPARITAPEAAAYFREQLAQRRQNHWIARADRAICCVRC